MKIAFDSLIFTTQRFGGVSRYITSLAGALNNLDVEARIFGKYHINHYLEASRGIADAGMAAIAKFPPKSRRAVHYLNDLIGRRSLTRWGADIVHESFHHSSAIAGSSLPRVCTVHDMIYEVFSDQLPGHEKSSLLKKESVERSDRVICISQKTKEDLMAQFGTSESKISVVHHGSEWLGEAESALVLSEAIANVAGHALKNAKPYLLFVGTRRNYKNFDTLLRAYGASLLHEKFDLRLFGGGELLPEEQHLIADLKIPMNSIHQSGGSDIDLARLYRNAAIFIYPSTYEGFGMPPLEAMTMGCPVLVSNAAPMPEVVGSAGEYFDPMSVESLSEALAKVLHSESRRQDLISAGTARCAKFTWENCAKETLAVYRSLV